MMTTASLPFPFPLKSADIDRRRAQILQALCTQDPDFAQIPVRRLQQRTLDCMLMLYDDIFLSRFLCRALPSLHVTLSFRLTSAAGKFLCTQDTRGKILNAEIRMSGDYLMRLCQGNFHLNGLTAHTPQDAFLIVFEHELCHALETALYGKTGHSKRFLSLANGLFAHTDTRHSLPTRQLEAAQEGLRVGCRVRFPFQDHELHGIISYIGKQATVMVPDSHGAYRDARGKRYEKYRVPLPLLDLEP